MKTTNARLCDLIADRFLYWAGTKMRRRASRLGRLRRIAVPMDDVIGIRLFTTGSFEQTQLDGVLDFVERQNNPEDAIFIDVGANIGVYSILLQGHFDRVIAFEANEITYGILSSNLKLARAANVDPVNLALSDKAGSSTIYLPDNGNLGWATLDANHHTVPVSPLDITCETLDAFVEKNDLDPTKIRLMKIDVEGHELGVLKGAETVLRKSRPALLCEVLSSEKGEPVFDYLKELGYTEFYAFRRRYKNMFNSHVELERLPDASSDKDALVLAM